MYKISIFNSGVETIIHYPNPDNKTPHVTKAELQERLSQAHNLTLEIPYGNPGYGNIHELSTLVKVYKESDNSIVFTGRALNVKPSMDSNGIFTTEVLCESALAFLIDETTRRWNYTDQTPAQIIGALINYYNYKGTNTLQVDKIFNVGTIELTQKITIDYNYETILNAHIKLRNILGGDLVVREVNGQYYLDYLKQQGDNNGVQISLGHNQNSISVDYDPTNIITRLIPLGYGQGVNQLDITSVNSGLDYIEDSTAKAKYGIISTSQTNTDIQNANTLKIWGQNILNQNTQPATRVECDYYDLSTIGVDKPLNLGDTAEIINSILNFDVFARVVEKDINLLEPYNPKLAIDTQPIRLSDDIIDLKQRSLSLENAPQGSTYIDTFGYAENIDKDHSFQLPIWISPDILYINRVRLHVDSQKFRAYEKGVTSQQVVATSGASSKSTSNASGKSTLTSAISNGLSNTFVKSWRDTIGVRPAPDVYAQQYIPVGSSGVDLWWLAHTHDIDHTHTVDTPDHSHGMDHTHPIEIPAQEVAITYGIYESTYPSNVQIKLNGTIIPNVTLSDGGSLDIDISQYFTQVGQTYNLEVTSAQNGRVNVWVSIQAFIQVK